MDENRYSPMNIDLEELDNPKTFFTQRREIRTKEENEVRIEGEIERYRRTGQSKNFFYPEKDRHYRKNSYIHIFIPKTNVS